MEGAEAGAEVGAEADLSHAQCSGKPHCLGGKWRAWTSQRGSQTVQVVPAAPRGGCKQEEEPGAEAGEGRQVLGTTAKMG